MNLSKCLLVLALMAGASTLQVQAQSAAPGGALAMPEPSSQALLNHFYEAIRKWDTPPPSNPGGLPASAVSAMANADFMDTRSKINTLGPKAWPLAARVAGILRTSQNNQYTLAWMILGMSPALTPSAEAISALRARHDAAGPDDKLASLALIGKLAMPDAVAFTAAQLRSPEAVTRLVASAGLAYSGKSDVDAAALALAGGLKDADRTVRSSSANSLRLLGPSAHVAAPALADYLRTRENVYQATAALRPMPIQHLKPLKSELESILADPKWTEFQKRDVVAILMRIESEP